MIMMFTDLKCTMLWLSRPENVGVMMGYVEMFVLELW
jgi:hypothetical protein